MKNDFNSDKFDPEKSKRENKKIMKDTLIFFGSLYIIFFLLGLFLFKKYFPVPNMKRQNYAYYVKSKNVNQQQVNPANPVNKKRFLPPKLNSKEMKKLIFKYFGDTLYSRISLTKGQASQTINIPLNYRIMLIPDRDYFIYDLDHEKMHFMNHHLYYSFDHLNAFYIQATKKAGVILDLWLLPIYNDK